MSYSSSKRLEQIISILEHHGISESECIAKDILTSDASAIEGARAENAYKCGWKDAQKAAYNTAENHGSYEAALGIRGLTPSIERLHAVSEGLAIRSRTHVAVEADKGLAISAENAQLKEVIKFYRDNWIPYQQFKHLPGLAWKPSEELLDDCGERARQVLEEKK